MSEAKSYDGGCHCGRVRYQVSTDLAQVITCNCSICAIQASVLTFVPESQFKLLAGEDAVSDYQFGRKSIHHLFCQTCGIRSFARGTMPDGTPMVAVNVRCLEGADVSGITPFAFDGKSL